MRTPVLLIVLATLVPWSAARALSIPAPAVPAARVRTGEVYRTPVARLPVGVREVELFLAPAAGSGRWIRLTAEHEAGERELRWRMPRIAAQRVRLVLRAGGPGGEWESPPSAAFGVELQDAGEPARLLRGESELGWRLEETHAAGPSALGVPPGREALGEAARGETLANDTRTPAAARPLGVRAPVCAAARRESACRRRPVFRNTPAFVPMLI